MSGHLGQGFCGPISGRSLAGSSGIMSVRKMLDRQPGSAPEVRRERDSITFVLEVAGAPERIKLVLRCTQTDIYASVINLPEPQR